MISNEIIALLGMGVMIILANWRMMYSLRTDMNAEFKSLRTDMNAKFDSQDVKIDILRTDMNAEFKAVRGEMSTLRADMNAEFKAVRGEMSTLRTDMESGFKALRSEMHTDSKAVRADIAGIHQRLSHTDGLLKGLYQTKEEPGNLNLKQEQAQ